MADAPKVPSNVTPETTNYGEAGQKATRVDRQFLIEGLFVGKDKGDSLTKDEVQFFPKTATDDEDGHVSGGKKITTIDGVGTKKYHKGSLQISHLITVPEDLVGSEIRGRIRTRGKHKWGPWTRLAKMRIIPNTRPSPPVNLSVQTGSSTPDYEGDHRDRDAGSALGGVETQVAVDWPGRVEMVWNDTSYQLGDPLTGPYTTISGEGGTDIAGGTHFRVSHGGRAFTPGEQPRRRHRTVDQFGAVGAWSPWVTWTVGEVPVPQVLPLPGEKQDSLTPSLGAKHNRPFTSLWIEVYRNNLVDPTRRLWQSGERSFSAVTTKRILYGSVGKAKALSWGRIIWVRVKVRIAGSSSQSPWSELQPVTINSVPNAPHVTILNAVQGPDGIWRVPTTTPRLTGPFSDDDQPGDRPTTQLAQVFSYPPGVNPIWQRTKTPPIEKFADVPASAGLVFEKAYLARMRYADTSHQSGPFGGFRFKTHRPPRVVADGSPPDPNDPTSRVRWAATFYGGATQFGYQILIDDVTDGAQDNILDTDIVEDETATFYDIEAYTLEDGHDYEVYVYVIDSFGMPGLLNGQATLTTSAMPLAPTVAEAYASPIATAAPSGNLPADTFTRTVANGLGTSSSGHGYVLQGPAGDFDVAATFATVGVDEGAERKAHFDAVQILDATVEVKAKTGAIIDGGSANFSLHLRCASLADHYRAALWFNDDQTVDITIDRILANTPTPLAQLRTSLTHAAGTDFWLKFEVDGTTLRARAWEDGDTEPVDWDVEATDEAATLAAAGSVGFGVEVQSSVDNAPITFSFDSFATT